MEKGLFRKKSLDRIASPEQLHDYMRVTSPRLWMLLGAIALMLVGFIVYASTARMENTVPITVRVEQYDFSGEEGFEGGQTRVTSMMAYLPSNLKDQVEQGMTVRLGQGREGTVSSIGVSLEGSLSILIDVEGNYMALPDGDYDAELVLESTTPISFLWN